ncbi:class I SAM-dependent methyltransferase [Microlunatus sp. GCM10028923]|uniref:class I SAM-dependent methyltransferase n=1 Tax=Microlunatus sp. GCM10028923 TaxID=3273400 RepID=UPI00361F99EB
MDGADPTGWSEVARDWSRLWGDHPRPVWTKIIRAAGLGPGSTVLDVGCGSGEWLAHLAGLGADLTGVDPAAGMIELARERLPDADLRVGSFDDLGVPDAAFDLVTAVNALQFAPDPEAGLAALLRVTRPGGHVAIANWAEDARNDLFRIEQAIADATGAAFQPGGPLREPGGLEALFARAGLTPTDAGLVALDWQVTEPDLLRGTLLGHPTDEQDELTPVVLRAAAPFRTGEGYRLTNHFRYALTTPTPTPKPR